MYCSRCKTDKPNEDFHRASDARGYQRWCKECARAKIRAWREKNRESVAKHDRRKALKSRYGITPEQYDDLMDAQGGVCAICGRAPGERNLDVDHCHATGRVRKLLCNRCNRVVGAVEALGLDRLAAYLA